MMKPDFFLISRFNLNLPRLRERAGLTSPEAIEKWTLGRARLFLGVTLPSVLHQSRRPDRWIVGFDSAPSEGARLVLEAIAAHDFIEPVFVEDARGFLPAIRRAVRSVNASDTIVTARLDADDALHRDYFRELARGVATLDRRPAALCFPFGAQLCDGSIRAFHVFSNAFVALVEERSDSMKTVLAAKHRRIEKVAPLVNLFPQQPMWLQNIHGGNVINHERDGLPLLDPCLMENFGHSSLVTS